MAVRGQVRNRTALSSRKDRQATTEYDGFDPEPVWTG
jgi:hypothetical protein